MAEFVEAAGLDQMVRTLISEHHQHLAQAKIKILFRMGSWTSKCKEVFAKTYKASERDRTLHGYDFVIIVNKDVWAILTMEQRWALLDHELCHCGINVNTGAYTIVEHDVQEFAAVIRRHGLWCQDVKAFGKVVQERLEFSEERAPAQVAAAVQVN